MYFDRLKKPNEQIFSYFTILKTIRLMEFIFCFNVQKIVYLLLKTKLRTVYISSFFFFYRHLKYTTLQYIDSIN